MENGTQSVLQETKEIAQKVREYFAEVEKKRTFGCNGRK